MRKSSAIRKSLILLVVGALAAGGVLAAPLSASAFGGYTYTGLFNVGNSVDVEFDFSGVDPPAAYTIEWRDQTTALAIGAGPSFLIPASVVGHKIFARAILTAPFTGNADASALTVHTGTVQGTDVTLSGTFTAGHAIHATIAGLYPAAAPVTYTWWRDGTTVIDGASAADYTLTSADVGHGITVGVHLGGDGYDNVIDLESVLSAVVIAAPVVVNAPLSFKTATPKITGTAKVGKTLRVAVGKWSPKPGFTYQWLANGKAIKKATKSSLKLTATLKSKKITVKVTGKKTGYVTVTKTSKATGKVKK